MSDFLDPGVPDPVSCHLVMSFELLRGREEEKIGSAAAAAADR